MRIVLEISDSSIPKGQDIIMVPIHFISGTVCEAGGHGFCVIPKGTGRLIDADALNRKDVNCANVPMNFIDTAQTIIPADKESEE